MYNTKDRFSKRRRLPLVLRIIDTLALKGTY